MLNRIYDNGKLIYEEGITCTPEKAYYSDTGRIRLFGEDKFMLTSMANSVLREIDKHSGASKTKK